MVTTLFCTDPRTHSFHMPSPLAHQSEDWGASGTIPGQDRIQATQNLWIETS